MSGLPRGWVSRPGSSSGQHVGHAECGNLTLVGERGSVAPLVASYLALLLLAGFGVTAVGLAMAAGNRIQGVADYALLFAHDRAVLAGMPQRPDLEREVGHFLATARSAQELQISQLKVWTEGATSHLRLCARHENLLGVGVRSVLICRESAAKSYELPRGLSGA